MNFSWVSDGNAWLGLVALTLLQVVLGVDNIVLLTILSHSLKRQERDRAQRLGVIVAMVSRLILLGFITVLAELDKPFANLWGHAVSVKAIILGLGGLFLIAKATQEIFHDVEHGGGEVHARPAKSLQSVLLQIFLLDVVFSIDQVITAVGLVPQTSVQVISVVLSVVAMLFFVNALARFMEKHPSVKLLALSFLVMIGVSLVASSTGFEIPRGYVYFSMAYAMGVEALNLRRKKNIKKNEVSIEDRLDAGP